VKSRLRPLSFLSLTLFAALAAFALSPRMPFAAGEADDAVDPMQEVTPEREAAALTFAQLHHPELADLLAALKAGNQSGYSDAIRDLFRTSERLARLKARLPDRYELELQLWKTDSRIHLLAARLAMEDSPSLQHQLRALLRDRLDQRAALLRYDRDKFAARVEKLETDLQELRQKGDASVESEFTRIMKSAKAAAAKPRNARSSNRGESVARQPEKGTSGSQPANVKQHRSNRKTDSQQ
jgi:hypothetical protein